MSYKLGVSVLLLLFASICFNCSDNTTTSHNTGNNVVYPNRNSNLKEINTKINSNTNLADLKNLKDANSDEYFKNVARNERIVPPDDFDKGPKRMAHVSTGEGRSYTVYRKDSKAIQEIRVYDKDDKNPTKSVVVYLKKGLKCELSIEQLPNPEKASSEKNMRIIEANSKKCTTNKE